MKCEDPKVVQMHQLAPRCRRCW